MSSDLSATLSTQFSMGRIFRDTLRLLRINLAGCTVVAAGYVGLWHVAFLFVDRAGDEFSWWNFAVRELWSCIMGGLANAALIYIFLVALSGSKPSFRDLGRGLSFAVPAIAVFFITDLPTTISTLLGATSPVQGQTMAVQVAVGIAGYILYVLWLAAAPAVVAEGLGVLAALRRSTFLTAGYRWPVFGLIFVTAIIFWILGWALFVLGNAVNAEIGHTGPNLIFWIGDYVVPAVALVFCAAVQTVAYCALRRAKEGAGIQALARVFD